MFWNLKRRVSLKRKDHHHLSVIHGFLQLSLYCPDIVNLADNTNLPISCVLNISLIWSLITICLSLHGEVWQCPVRFFIVITDLNVGLACEDEDGMGMGRPCLLGYMYIVVILLNNRIEFFCKSLCFSWIELYLLQNRLMFSVSQALAEWVCILTIGYDFE